MHYGVVDADDKLVHYTDVPLPGPRLPHDMAFTENYAILNDLPLFWDPRLLERNVHLPRFHPDLPSRFAVIPRRGDTGEIRWFEAEPTYVLHFTERVRGRRRDRAGRLLPGRPGAGRQPRGDKWQTSFRFLALDRLQTRLHRWRFNLVTGQTREERLTDSITEFGMINAEVRRPRIPVHVCRDRSARLVPVRRLGQARPEDRFRRTLSVRRRGLRQRDRDGDPGRVVGRGRRLSRHVDHRHERRRLLVPGVRRGTGCRWPGMQTRTAGTDLEWDAFDVGGGCRAAPVARRRRRAGRDRPLSEPR